MTTLSETPKSSLPMLGVGLGLRQPLFDETLASADRIDWVEIVPENYMGRGGYSRRRLEQAAGVFPIISHGVNLSLGSIDPLSETYLQELQALFDCIKPAWFSDHVCFSSVGGAYLNDLMPLPFTREALAHVVQRVKAVQARFDIPLLVENVSYYTHFGHSEMTEAQFLAELLEQTDCGLLLDVNNIYVNGRNHGYDPIKFLDTLPLERTIQVHVAGHLEQDFIVDTHGASVCPEVYALLGELLSRTSVNGILLERDLEIPPFADLMAEMAEIRSIVAKVRPGMPGAKPLGVSLQF